MTNIMRKTAQKGNYVTKKMTLTELANMTPQDIKNAAAVIVYKDNLNAAEVVSVKTLSILEQALCSLPEVNVSKVCTIVRYANMLPNGQLIISYFGAKPNEEIIAAMAKLAKTASSINGAIFSGYASLTAALGEEKHFSPGLAIPAGWANIRVANKDEIAFTLGKTAQKMTVNNFATGQWNKVTEIDSFEKNALFMDRIQNGTTNVVTEDKVIRGYSLQTKKAVQILDQSIKLKVLSIVQLAKSSVIGTPLGLTQEPIHVHAV